MHLSTDDLATAADGALSGTAKTHLETCATCREAVARLSALVADVKSNAVPEPSPLFWDHFSARIREATASEPTPDARFSLLSRPLVTIGGLAAIVVLIVLWSFPARDRTVAPVPAPVTAAGPRPADPDVAWQTMSDMAAAMTADDVRTATAPAPDRASVLSDLSDDERAAFVALLKMEMGDVQ